MQKGQQENSSKERNFDKERQKGAALGWHKY